jgi:glutaredoxin
MSIASRVLMYSTAVCPFCVRAEQLLRARGVVEIEKVRVDLDPARRSRDARKDRQAYGSTDLHRRNARRWLRRADCPRSCGQAAALARG